jgi:exosortase A
MMVDHDIVAGARQEDAGPVIAAPSSASVTASQKRWTLGVPLTVALLVVGVLALYWKTTLSMVAIWERSETFVHGFVVLPIFFYLVWREREALESLELKPCTTALLGMAAAGGVWLLGELVSAASVSQFAMVAMIPFAVWAVLGTRIAMALGIPLAFLFFAVPIGEFLMPTLIDWTADFTVAALRASTIPVYREGNFFTIPSGNWSVVEACSGLRYLIASFMVGCLYAYLSYRSPLRRVAFITASIIVPIIANWMRAYMIVMIGHLSGNHLAVGVDHLIYGWVFFGLVMLLLFWIGGRWREDLDDRKTALPVKAGNAVVQASTIGQPTRKVWATALAALVLAAIWLPLQAKLDVSGNATPVRFPAVVGANGWVAVSDKISDWRPDLLSARAEYRQTFARGGQRVGLYVAFYRGQTQDSKAITSSNELVNTKNRSWRLASAGAVQAETGSGPLSVRTAVVASERARLALWQWYWIDGRATSNDYAAKLYQAMSILEGHGDPVAWVIIYTPTETDEPPARAALQAFTTDMLGAIATALRDAAAE